MYRPQGNKPQPVHISQILVDSIPETPDQQRSRLRKEQREHARQVRQTRKRLYQQNKERLFAGRRAYFERRAAERTPPPEYTHITDHTGRSIRVKTKNASRRQRHYDNLRKQIMSQPHNSDMTTQPIQYTYIMEENAFYQTLPKHINRRIEESSLDVEPRWNADDPRKRQSWQAFCNDFIGQNYGAIAQDLLSLHNSDDPASKTQFLKFIMEMGKQGNPQALQLDVNANVKQQTDIYAQLQSLSQLSAIQQPELLMSGSDTPPEQLTSGTYPSAQLSEAEHTDMPVDAEQPDAYTDLNQLAQQDIPYHAAEPIADMPIPEADAQQMSEAYPVAEPIAYEDTEPIQGAYQITNRPISPN